MEQGLLQYSKCGSLRSTRVGGCQQTGFKGHVATDGSLLGIAGKWGACGWSVVQLEYDEELGPSHGMYVSMEAELEVQRTINRAGGQQRHYGRAMERRKKMH